VLFGQQQFDITGVDWEATTDVERSDAKTITGHHPAVLGLDAAGLAFRPAEWAHRPVHYRPRQRRASTPPAASSRCRGT